MKRSMMGEKKYPANPWLYLPLAMDTEDQSGNHRSVITQDISFKNNYAVFNGRSTYLDTGYVINPSIRACTIVFWMKIQELYSGFTYIMASLYGKPDPYWQSYMYGTYIDSKMLIRSWAYGGVMYDANVADFTILDYCKYCFVYSPNNSRLYINDKLASQGGPGTKAADTTLAFNSRRAYQNDYSEYSKIELSNLFIYDRELTEQEVKSIKF